MKITIYNVNEKWSEISGKLSDKLKNVYKSLNVAENAELYDDAVEMSETDDEWKEVVKKYDAFIAAVNAELDAAEKPVEKPKPQPQPAEPKKPEPKAVKTDYKKGDYVKYKGKVYEVLDVDQWGVTIDTFGTNVIKELVEFDQVTPAEKPVEKPQPKANKVFYELQIRLNKKIGDNYDSIEQAKKHAEKYLAKDKTINAIAVYKTTYFGDRDAVESSFVEYVYQKPTAEPKPKAKPQPKAKPVAEQVITLEPSVKLIMKYVELLKKKKPTIADARRVANAFSKAITEREVRKTDKYAAEINAIKGKLLDFINKGAEIKDSHFDKYNDIANKQVLHPFVKIVRAYIKINGKENVKKQANTICTNIANLCKVLPADFEFMAQLKSIEKSLNNYIEGKTATPKMLQTELSGLGRIADNDEVPETLDGMDIIKNTRKFDNKFDDETKVRDAVIEDLSEYNFVAENEEDVQQFFGERDCGDRGIYSSVEQVFSVLGIEERGYIPVYDVRIVSNYVDTGSVDYIYSVIVTVR